jgi:hypothetical protein
MDRALARLNFRSEVCIPDVASHPRADVGHAFTICE